MLAIYRIIKPEKESDEMNSLSDELLIEAYRAAVDLELNTDFISLLFNEIRSRNIVL